eukprot:gnl/TRDRNA2_/TRDRNA2_170487_c0_seq6.p1 gnl/TRDRNA2_/TRDRNA2_170487_c0~~gnl/TRDRNA2_/TRDRNA2_170487_c0_seq6.p1  ORF type:complete len:106 (-),score=1.37 gnl/TRDRNA2_/TRDRNA2_170487_c0_seq6:10-327(-)
MFKAHKAVNLRKSEEPPALDLPRAGLDDLASQRQRSYKQYTIRFFHLAKTGMLLRISEPMQRQHLTPKHNAFLIACYNNALRRGHCCHTHKGLEVRMVRRVFPTD